MGYGHGVVEGKGVGYNVDAVCEQPGCNIKIHRGLAYSCGDEIGSGYGFCNGFFCEKHLYMLGFGNAPVCQNCANDVARIKHQKLPFKNRGYCPCHKA